MIRKYLNLLAAVSVFVTAPLCSQHTENSAHPVLFEALTRDDTAKAQHYLQNHPDAIHACNKSNDTPLHVVAKHGSAEITDILLKAGASTNAQDAVGGTPLHYAALRGDVAIIQTLVCHGASVNTTDADHNTPVHVAAENGHLKAVRYLVDCGGTVYEKNFDDDTPIHLAAASGNRALVAFLMARGAHLHTLNSYGQTPLCRASENGHTPVIQFLIDHGARFNEDVLRFAIIGGYISVVEFFLKRYPHCIEMRDSRGLTPIEYAVKHFHLRVVKLLLENGVSTDDVCGRSVLDLCRQAPSLSFYDEDSATIAQNKIKRDALIRFLFKNGAPLGQTGHTLFQSIPGLKQDIESNNHKIIQSLPENMPRDLKTLMLSFISPITVPTTGKRKRGRDQSPADMVKSGHKKKQRPS